MVLSSAVGIAPYDDVWGNGLVAWPKVLTGRCCGRCGDEAMRQLGAMGSLTLCSTQHCLYPAILHLFILLFRLGVCFCEKQTTAPQALNQPYLVGQLLEAIFSASVRARLQLFLATEPASP